MVVATVGTLLVGWLSVAQVKTPVHLRVLRRMESPGSELALSCDGRLLAGSTRNGVFWMETRGRGSRSPVPEEGTPIFGRGERQLMIAGSQLRWLDLDSGEVTASALKVMHGKRRADILWASIARDRSFVLVHARLNHRSGSPQGDLFRWDTKSGALDLVSKGFGFVLDFAWSPDGTHAAAGVEYNTGPCGNAGRAGALQVMDLRSGQMRGVAGEGPVFGVDFSKDGERIYWVDQAGILEAMTEDLALVREVGCQMRFLQRIGEHHALTHDRLSLFLWDLRRLEPICHWRFDATRENNKLVRPKRARLTNGAVVPQRPRSTGVWPCIDEEVTIWDVVVSKDGSTCAVQGGGEVVLFEIVGL